VQNKSIWRRAKNVAETDKKQKTQKQNKDVKKSEQHFPSF
jgi:hypothetical protein